jgi:TatD DNase family protein
MIDVHCHLENKDFDEDRDQVIEDCKKDLDAVIISCTKPENLDKCLEIAEKHKGFIYLTVSWHPIYIEEVTEEKRKNYFDFIKKNKEKFVGIGECGLDYYWIKEENLREKQKELFIEHIKLARELDLPLVIHSRNAEKECLEILEQQKAEKVLLHFFANYKLAEEVKKTNYFVSINTAILRSKVIRKILKVLGLRRIMIETDAPWMGFGKRNTPLGVKLIIDKMAQLEKKRFEEVDKITTQTAINFFLI